jgi:hypothetical protein
LQFQLQLNPYADGHGTPFKRFNTLLNTLASFSTATDPTPLPTPSERHKLVRDALRLVFLRATGSTGGVWRVELQAMQRATRGFTDALMVYL